MTAFKHGPKPVIGLVGAIGAGKSTAARCFAARGGLVIDADGLGHAALTEPKVIQTLVDRWGGSVRKADGSLDRHAIGKIVFGNRGERDMLQSVVFPYIAERVREEIERGMNIPDVPFVINDAALLLEAGWANTVDKIVYVDAPRELRLARVAARSGWTAADLEAREAAQWPADQKKKQADVVIINDSGTAELQEQLDRLLNGWGLLVGKSKPTGRDASSSD